MPRITNDMIERQVKRLNTLCGVGDEMYKPRHDISGRLIANGGVHYLQGAYSGFQIERMCEGGGSSHLFSVGFVPKRELYGLLVAYIDGMERHKALNPPEPARLTTYNVEAKVATGDTAHGYEWFEYRKRRALYLSDSYPNRGRATPARSVLTQAHPHSGTSRPRVMSGAKLQRVDVEAKVAKVATGDATHGYEYKWFELQAPSIWDQATMKRELEARGYDVKRIRTVAQVDQGK